MSQLVGRVHRLDRAERWLYNGLHSLDFSFWYYQRPLWDVGMILLSLGGLTTSAIGLFLGLKRIVRGLRSGAVPVAQPDPVFWSDRDPAEPSTDARTQLRISQLPTSKPILIQRLEVGSGAGSSTESQPNPSQLNVTVCKCALSVDDDFVNRVPALIVVSSA